MLDWGYVTKPVFSSSFSKLQQRWLEYFQLFNIFVTMQWHNTEYDILHISPSALTYLLWTEVAGTQLLAHHSEVLQQNSLNPTAFKE